MTHEEVSEKYGTIRLTFVSYHKGVAAFAYEDGSIVISAWKGRMTHEDAYHNSFAASAVVGTPSDLWTYIEIHTNDGDLLFSYEEPW